MVNWTQIGNSLAGLKNWVKLWILVLMLVNGCSFFFLSSPIGKWTAIAVVIIAVSNSFLIVFYSGLTRALAFPHLVWIPLILAIFLRLSLDGQQNGPGSIEFGLGVIVGVINAVSLLFDLNDCVQWIKGKREVLGLELN